jgi:hypothetical protein
MLNEENEDTVKYVYLSDEGIYGTIVSYGAYASIIEYYDAGIRYTIEVINDDFIIIDEIGIGYVDEIEEEEELE